MIYRFGDYELDSDCFELRKNGAAQSIEPQVFSLLELLIANHGRLVSKDEINLRVWGGRIVSEAVVSSRVRAARQAIGDNGKDQSMIRTIHARGFRFVGDVVTASDVETLSVEIVEEPVAPQGTDEEPVASRPSIAILPLQLLTHEERYNALGDAISQEVIVELAGLRSLLVISRGSSFRFRGGDIDLSAVGEILGARYVLSGTIGFFADEAIVTVELARVSDGEILWAERFVRPVDELITLRTTICSHIVSAIESRIQMAEAQKSLKLPTENLDAWTAYHRGLWHMYRFNKYDNEIAGRMFDRAITADPTFARGYAGLSFTHHQNVLIGYTENIENERALTRKFAEKSFELDPLDPFVNLTMGRSSWICGEFSNALPWFDRSVEISPNYALAHYNRGVIDALLGNGAESEDNVKRAITLSPIDPLRYAMLATCALSHLVRGDFANAADWSIRAVRSPNAHFHIFIIAAVSCELAGRPDEAKRCVERIRLTIKEPVQDEFFRSFDFHEAQTLLLVKESMNRLGL